MIVNRLEISFADDENLLTLGYVEGCVDCCTILNILKTTVLDSVPDRSWDNSNE